MDYWQSTTHFYEGCLCLVLGFEFGFEAVQLYPHIFKSSILAFDDLVTPTFVMLGLDSMEHEATRATGCNQ